MARRKYESDRIQRAIPIVGGRQVADLSPLARAEASKSEQISALVDTMKGFVAEKFEMQAKESAAKIALENDPLKVLAETKDSLKIVDKLAFALSSTQLKNNLLTSVNNKIMQQTIESKTNQDTPEIFNTKVNSIINNELQSIRPNFDSPLFELSFRDDIAKSVNKTVQDYSSDLVKMQLEDLHYEKGKELDGATLLDMQAFDFNFTQVKKHIKDNPNIYYTDKLKDEALNKSKTKAYKNLIDIIKQNSNMTSQEKAIYKDAFLNIRDIANAENNLEHFTIAEAMLETLDSSGAVDLKTQAEAFEQGIGDKNSIIGQVIELSKNKNLPMGDIFDEVLKGLSGKELVKQKKELNDFYIKYVEDKIHYQSQLDGISLSLNPDGTFADPAALTYIQKNYPKFETFNSAYNIKSVVAQSKRIQNPLKQYEFFKNYFGQFAALSDYNVEDVADDFLAKASNLPKEDKALAEKMAYLFTYDDPTARIFIMGIDQRQKVTEEKSHLVTTLKDQESNIQSAVDKYTVALRPAQVEHYKDLARDYLAGIMQGKINYVPSGDEVELAVEAAFGIKRNGEGDIIHGYSEHGDGNLWDANAQKMMYENKQITKDEMYDIIKENLSNDNLSNFLLTEERNPETGELIFVPTKKLPVGFLKKVLQPNITRLFVPGKDQPDIRKEIVLQEKEIDFTDEFVSNLFITNSDETNDLFYLSDRSSDSQHTDRRIIRSPDGKKIFFDAYGFMKAYKDYEKFINRAEYERADAASFYVGPKYENPSMTIFGVPIYFRSELKLLKDYEKDKMRRFKTALPSFSEFMETLNAPLMEGAK